MTRHDDLFARSLLYRHRLGWLFAWFCWACTWVGLVFLALMLLGIGWQAWGWLDWQFLTSYDSGNGEKAGIFPGIIGSLWLAALTAVFAIPVGVGAAIYLEEYARPTRLNWFIQLNIANLAGVPSVVYGILGFTLFVRMFGLAKQVYTVNMGLFSFDVTLPFGRSLISGALTLGLLSLPVIIIAAQEALRAVPPSIRHASLALGATKWQTIWYQVLPAAVPGILTGVILAISRAMGETAPLAVLGAATYITFVPGRMSKAADLASPEKWARAPFDEFTAMPLQIYNWVEHQSSAFPHVAAAGILVLLAVLLVLNSLAIMVRQHYQSKIRW